MEARINNLKIKVKTDVQIAALHTANIEGQILQLLSHIEQQLNQLSSFSLVQVPFPPTPFGPSLEPSGPSAPPANTQN